MSLNNFQSYVSILLICTFCYELVKSQLVTTIAGSGQAKTSDGQGLSADVNVPKHIAADSKGNLFFVDASRTIRMVNSTFYVSTVISGAGRWGIALDPFENIIYGDDTKGAAGVISNMSIYRLINGVASSVAMGMHNPAGFNVD